MKVREWKIVNPVYHYVILIRQGGTLKQAIAWAKKKLGCEFRIKGHVTVGRIFIKDDEITHCIWFPEKPGGGTVAHEAYHSIMHVMESVGMERPTRENEEAYAYLLAWTVIEIGRLLW
jgi:hypothetical protein